MTESIATRIAPAEPPKKHSPKPFVCSFNGVCAACDSRQRKGLPLQQKTKMNRVPEFEIDPFLLPTCDHGGGPVNLSYVAPATDQMPLKRVYRRAQCDAEKLILTANSSR